VKSELAVVLSCTVVPAPNISPIIPLQLKTGKRPKILTYIYYGNLNCVSIFGCTVYISYACHTEIDIISLNTDQFSFEMALQCYCGFSWRRDERAYSKHEYVE